MEIFRWLQHKAPVAEPEPFVVAIPPPYETPTMPPVAEMPAQTDVILPPSASGVSEQPTPRVAQPASIPPQPASPLERVGITPLPPLLALKLPRMQEPALGRTINFRKLAAIDIVFLGHKVIVAEFAAGVLLSTALGIFVLIRGQTFSQDVVGAYLICLGINYVPMLLYAVDITRKQSASEEMAEELSDKRKAMAKYRRQSLLLLVPLLVPILALTQSRQAINSGSN